MLTNVDLGVLILRVVVGLIFVGHGSQKLFGWFGGKGMQGHTGVMEHLGLRPASVWGYLSALSEFLGGLFFALGLLTPFAAAVLIGVMLVAIATVHVRKGFWNTQGGYEFPLLLAVVAFVIGLVGPGSYSLDRAFGLQLPEPEAYGVALVLMLIGVGVVVMQRSSAASRERPPA